VKIDFAYVARWWPVREGMLEVETTTEILTLLFRMTTIHGLGSRLTLDLNGRDSGEADY